MAARKDVRMKKLFRRANHEKSWENWEDWDSTEEDDREVYGEDPEYGDSEYIDEYGDVEEASDLEDSYDEADDMGTDDAVYYEADGMDADGGIYDEADDMGTDDAVYYEADGMDADGGIYDDADDADAGGAIYYEADDEDADGATYYDVDDADADSAIYYGADDPDGNGDIYYAEGASEEELDSDAYCEEVIAGLTDAYDTGTVSGEDVDLYYAEEEDRFGEDAYYAEDDNEDDQDAYYIGTTSTGSQGGLSGRKGRHRNKNSFLRKIQRGIGNMTAMDRVIVCTGIGVLVMAIILGSVFVSNKVVENQISDFVNVGNQLDGIALIGEQGLLAVADAQLAKAAAVTIIEEEEEKDSQGGYDETEYTKEVTVKMEMTSIQRDLKIKFINQKTEKLVANVPFAVTVTGPDKKTVIWSDDDMDGIIYKKDIAPGSYTVSMEALTDEKYADYKISTEKQSTTVKKDINYEKVDVKGEVKKETEVNAKKEDTKVNETVVESTLQDTVAWVESKVISAAYNEVSKNDIPNPMTIVMGKGASRLILAVSEGDAQVTPSPTQEPTPTPTPTDEPTPTPDQSGDPGQTTEPTGSPSETPTGSPSASPAVTPIPPTLAKGKLAAPATFAVSVGKEAFFQVTATEFTTTVKDKDGKDVAVRLKYTVSTDKGDIATAAVDQTGKVTIKGIKAGTATVTVKTNYDPASVTTATVSQDTEAIATITVTVMGKGTIALDKTAATVFLKEPVTINATLANVSESDPVVTAVSSDTTVATVAVANKRSVTITGVKAGSATITVKYVDPATKEELSATCAVTVKANPKEDRTTPLKDKNGNLVYVNENGTYRQATHADYFTASKFYLQGTARYTGWQTLDGKVYFFNANGDKVTGEQVIQGAKYNFASDGSLVTGNGALGIDVSKWNGTIDWNAVKNSGINYVIIRCGYRGSSQGTLIEDPKFTANIKGATAAGLKVGVYFFTQAIDEREAVEEASMVLEQVKNYKISYPIFLDVEASGGRGDAISKETRTAVCKAFCATIQNAGYNAGIYANKNWLETKLDPGALSAYKIWLAQYAAAPTYKGRYDLWQYRSTGSVSGISGNVDLNLSYLGY